jgi:hypothetical protein
MLDSLKKRPGSLRWAPRQRFGATDHGKLAVQQYEEAIRRYQQSSEKSREALVLAQKEWAAQFGVAEGDASILSEFTGAKEKLPREVQAALEDCGTSLQDVQAAVDRLYQAGLLQAAGGAAPLPQGRPDAANG